VAGADGWPRVAMMGGSLGGLTAALLLRDLGCEVDVYERSRSELEGRGAGIVVHPVTVRYFSERGGPDIQRLSTFAPLRRYLGRGGEVLHELLREYRFTAYNTLYRALLDHLGPDRYHLGHAITAIEPDGGRVRFGFADGGGAQADLLVCADGIASTARSLLLPEVEHAYSGYVAWRGMAPEQALSGATYARLQDAITYVLLAGSHILVYPIPAPDGAVDVGRRLQNFVWYRNVDAGVLQALLTDTHGARRALSMPPGTIAEGFIDELRAAAERHLPAPVAEVVVRSPQPFVQVVVDAAVPRMVHGRACLIGDAAFTVRPHTAAATAKAAADAWTLASCLAASGGDVDAALAAWEPGQRELGGRLLARARDMGDRSQFGEGWQPADRSLDFGLYGPGW
jgi:2,6-dihydroxypyridine 3-monooxygenase